MAGWRLPYGRALDDWDHEGIVGALTDDVVIRVAVHDQPMQGRETADFLFHALREELGELRVTDEIVDQGKAVVLFETSIGGADAQGLNVLAFDESGKVRELTVFFRPLEALQRIAEVIGRRMAERFGALE